MTFSGTRNGPAWHGHHEHDEDNHYVVMVTMPPWTVGDAFCVAGPLWRESTGDRWIPF